MATIMWDKEVADAYDVVYAASSNLMSDRAIPRSYRMKGGLRCAHLPARECRGATSLVKFHWNPGTGTTENCALALLNTGRPASLLRGDRMRSTAAALADRSGHDHSIDTTPLKLMGK